MQRLICKNWEVFKQADFVIEQIVCEEIHDVSCDNAQSQVITERSDFFKKFVLSAGFSVLNMAQ